jgi:hypothetical protein
MADFQSVSDLPGGSMDVHVRVHSVEQFWSGTSMSEGLMLDELTNRDRCSFGGTGRLHAQPA